MSTSETIIIALGAGLIGSFSWAIAATLDLRLTKVELEAAQSMVAAQAAALRERHAKVRNQAAELSQLLALRSADKLLLRGLRAGIAHLGSMADGSAPMESCDGQQPPEAEALLESPVPADKPPCETGALYIDGDRPCPVCDVGPCAKAVA